MTKGTAALPLRATAGLSSQPLLAGAFMCRGRGLALRVSQGLVDDLIQPLPIDHFHKGHTLGLAGDDPDGRRVLDANAFAEIDVCLDPRCELFLRVPDKRK